jgi:ABC-2 type transport system ATP-binding protein
MLKIERLKVKYGSFTALDISAPISIDSGDRIGIIGGNGAGKSTFVKAVCGLVNYEGKIDTVLKPADIALHLQENSYIKRMPVKFIIEAVFNTNVYKNEALMEIIRFFDFEQCLRKKFAALSGGQKQKLTIIMVLMQDKPLTFFDEVTGGLDFEARQKLMSKVSDWYRGRENALCVVSHYYDELENLINKLLIIDNGKVVDYGTVGELFKKYCSDVIFVIENSVRNDALTREFSKIEAPKHLLAFPCADIGTERKLSELFIGENINYKRSNKDIEILFCNALKAHTEKRGEQTYEN